MFMFPLPTAPPILPFDRVGTAAAARKRDRRAIYPGDRKP
jgi:hypothetical protein